MRVESAEEKICMAFLTPDQDSEIQPDCKKTSNPEVARDVPGGVIANCEGPTT